MEKNTKDSKVTVSQFFAVKLAYLLSTEEGQIGNEDRFTKEKDQEGQKKGSGKPDVGMMRDAEWTTSEDSL